MSRIDVRGMEAQQVSPTTTVTQPVDHRSGIGEIARAGANLFGQVMERRGERAKTAAIGESIRTQLGIVVGGEGEMEVDPELDAARKETAEVIERSRRAERAGNLTQAQIKMKQAQELLRIVERHPGYEREVVAAANSVSPFLAGLGVEADQEAIRQQQAMAEAANMYRPMLSGQTMPDGTVLGRADLAMMTDEQVARMGDIVFAEPIRRIDDARRVLEANEINESIDDLTRKRHARAGATDLINNVLIANSQNLSVLLSDPSRSREENISLLLETREVTTQLLLNDVARFSPEVATKYQGFVTDYFDDMIAKVQAGEQVKAVENQVKFLRVATELGMLEGMPDLAALSQISRDLGPMFQDSTFTEAMARYGLHMFQNSNMSDFRATNFFNLRPGQVHPTREEAREQTGEFQKYLRAVVDSGEAIGPSVHTAVENALQNLVDTPYIFNDKGS
jgi:hypothetical protein